MVRTPRNLLSLLIALAQIAVVFANFSTSIEWRCRACHRRFIADPGRIE